jgi:hypothetical protein
VIFLRLYIGRYSRRLYSGRLYSRLVNYPVVSSQSSQEVLLLLFIESHVLHVLPRDVDACWWQHYSPDRMCLILIMVVVVNGDVDHKVTLQPVATE